MIRPAETAADSSNANGMKKCPNTSAIATKPHDPRMRAMYQGISSGRLPDQMIRNCENEKYAHSITKASIRLPRSRK